MASPRTKRRLVRRLVPLIALAACDTAMVWSKPDASHQAFVQARAQCRAEATTGGGALHWLGFGRTDAFEACMARSGWTLVERPPGAAVSW